MIFFQVADELVQEFSDPDKHLSPTDQVLVINHILLEDRKEDEHLYSQLSHSDHFS